MVGYRNMYEFSPLVLYALQKAALRNKNEYN